MYVKTIYYADNGKEFETERECQLYENRVKGNPIKPNIRFWDFDLNEIPSHLVFDADEVACFKCETPEDFDQKGVCLNKVVCGKNEKTSLFFWDLENQCYMTTKRYENEWDSFYSKAKKLEKRLEEEKRNEVEDEED